MKLFAHILTSGAGEEGPSVPSLAGRCSKLGRGGVVPQSGTDERSFLLLGPTIASISSPKFPDDLLVERLRR
jgi:hypothetical protein